VFAGMLFAAGTLGDRFGRKGALQGGLLLFLVAAVGGILADSSGQVIAVRAAMGLAAAFVMPSTLSILTTVFPVHERGRAIGLWAGIAAGGAALGPPISGLLLEHFWWGSVFVVNVPLVVGALVAGWWLVPRSKDPDGTRLDIPGTVLSIVAIGALVYAIIEAPNAGWLSVDTAVVATVAVVAMACFLAWKSAARVPMLDLQLFRDRRFSVASLGIALAFFTMFGIFFLMTQLLQLAHGLSPVEAGLAILPMSFTLMLVAPRSQLLVARYGVATVVPIGLGTMAGGLLVLASVAGAASVWWIYLGLLPMAAGMGITMAPLTTLIMTAVPAGRAGVGSAMNDTTRELGGALGVAVLGSLTTTVYARQVEPVLDGLPADVASEARTGLAGGLRTAASLADPALADSASSAFLDGLTTAMLVGAALAGTAALVARRWLPRSDAEERAAPAIDEAAASPAS